MILSRVSPNTDAPMVWSVERDVSAMELSTYVRFEGSGMSTWKATKGVSFMMSRWTVTVSKASTVPS